MDSGTIVLVIMALLELLILIVVSCAIPWAMSVAADIKGIKTTLQIREKQQEEIDNLKQELTEIKLTLARQEA